MKQISSMDLFFLVKEFKNIENSRIETFYYEENIFYIRLYVKAKGHIYLNYKLGSYIYLSENKENTSHPSSFVSYLRKFLKNGFLESIEQIPGERILKLGISKKNDNDELIKYFIFLELFPPGNIIITDSDLVIINTLKRKKFKDRKIIVKDLYKLPPAKELLISKLNLEKLSTSLEKSDLSIVKFLAIKLGIGGKFSEEVCSSRDIDKNKISSKVTKEDAENILNNINELLSREINPYSVIDENELINNFIPFDFKSIDKEKKKESTFNDCVLKYFETFKSNVDNREKDFLKQLKKYTNILKKQEEQKEKININSQKYTDLGNKIYENYSILEEIINSINNAAKDKGWDSVIDTIKTNEKLSKIIKKLDYKKNRIIFNLE